MCPKRTILPAHLALAADDRDAGRLAHRARRSPARRCRRACGSPSRRRTVVVGREELEPIAFTPARQARPRRTCRSCAASRPVLEDHLERDVEPADERDRPARTGSRPSPASRRRAPSRSSSAASCASRSPRAPPARWRRTRGPAGHMSALCELVSDDVEAPVVGLERNGREARDRVDDDERARACDSLRRSPARRRRRPSTCPSASGRRPWRRRSPQAGADLVGDSASRPTRSAHGRRRARSPARSRPSARRSSRARRQRTRSPGEQRFGHGGFHRGRSGRA